MISREHADTFTRVYLALPLVCSSCVSKSISSSAKEILGRMVCFPDGKISPKTVNKADLIRDVSVLSKVFEQEAGKDFKRFSDALATDPVEKFGISQTFQKEHNVTIFKTDKGAEERTVLGIVLVPETVDSQGDIYSEQEIRKTAHGFMEKYQQFGLQHTKMVDDVKVLESYIAPVDFEIDGQQVKKGTWLMLSKILNDDIWKAVKEEKLTGYSIGGAAIKIFLDEEDDE